MNNKSKFLHRTGRKLSFAFLLCKLSCTCNKVVHNTVKVGQFFQSLLSVLLPLLLLVLLQEQSITRKIKRQQRGSKIHFDQHSMHFALHHELHFKYSPAKCANFLCNFLHILDYFNQDEYFSNFMFLDVKFHVKCTKISLKSPAPY